MKILKIILWKLWVCKKMWIGLFQKKPKEGGWAGGHGISGVIEKRGCGNSRGQLK